MLLLVQVQGRIRRSSLEEFLRTFGKEAIGPRTLKLSIGRYWDMQNLRILTSGLDIEDSDMLWLDIGDALRKLPIGGFPNPA